MSNRASTTLTDYLLIGINPALVMLKLGGLVGFLLEAFYRGEFDERLRFIFAMYVMGSVAIARISIQDGRGRASLFALPLAVLTAIALGRFVTYAGPLSMMAMPLNCGILALVWWSADRLTHDCTVIEETGETPATGLWRAFRQRGAVGGLAGMWIIYFALAAVPLFGLGQLFLPVDNGPSQSRAFRFLTLYLASGLALLASTSFLNLRKYLRQRGVEVPASMTFRWLVWGGASIAAILLASALLPRPQGWNQPSLAALSPPGLKASRWGWGKQPGAKQSGGAQSGGAQPGGAQPGGAQPGGAQSGGAQPGAGQSGGAQSGGAQSGGAQAGGAQAGGAQAGGAQPGGAQSGARQASAGQTGATQSQATQPEAGQSGGAQPGAEQSGSGQAAAAKSSPVPLAESTNASNGLDFSGIGTFVGGLFRLAFFAGTLVLLAWFAWRSRVELMEAWRQLCREWEAFWAKWRGGRVHETQAEVAQPSLPIEVRFADFSDPFTTGMAQRVSLGELVAYSFAAMEAWGRERGCPRAADQTPLEFAQRLGAAQSMVAAEVLAVADLYCQHAYAGGVLPSTAANSIRRLWQRLTA